MADSKQISNDLIETLGEAGIKIDPDVMAQYRIEGLTPKAVLFPKDARQVSEVVTYAY